MRFPLLPAAFALTIMMAGSAFAADPAAPSDSNAGATPIAGDSVFEAFHGRPGIDRVTATLVRLYKTDPRIKDIFAAADDARLARLLAEQICFITGGPCHYTGQDMKAAHADMGLQTADFNALVEDLQAAMDAERVPFWAQSKLLAKLAPMERVVVTR
jgi:hemoglobin